MNFSQQLSGIATFICKITKIVRALWLAVRRVCRIACKHGCDVKIFCILRASHAGTNLKKKLSWKLDKSTLFTHSLVGRNLENLYKHTVSIFFRLSWHCKREKILSLIGILFAKQELIARARLHVQDFATGKNFSFSLCHNKVFWVFLGKVNL